MYPWVLYGYIRRGGFIGTDAIVRLPRFHLNNILIGVVHCVCIHERVIILFMSRNTHKHIATILHTLFDFLHDITNP